MSHLQRRLVLNIVSLCTAMLVAAALHAQKAHSAEDAGYLETASRELRTGDPQQALAILTAHMLDGASDETQATHYGLVCRAWLETGDPERARSGCLKAIEANDKRSRWRDYNNLGVAEFRRGDAGAAQAAFREAAVLSGSVFTPRKNLDIVRSVEIGGGDAQAAAAGLVIR